MYLGYQNGKIKFYTKEILNPYLYQIERSEHADKEYILEGEEYVLKDDAWAEKRAQKEADRIAQLSLTKRELFLCLYKALKVTPQMVRKNIEDNPEALIEFDYAEKYYRGNPLVESLGKVLGLDSKVIDEIFLSGGNPDVLNNLEGGGEIDA